MISICILYLPFPLFLFYLVLFLLCNHGRPLHVRQIGLSNSAEIIFSKTVGGQHGFWGEKALRAKRLSARTELLYLVLF